jgi:uroporphyrin-III C-methyltransferase/precorrin-2 dehydrogenase/sirohydrochlorin ferrochelatase
MDYLPMFVDLRGRACLVVGGGEVALRKAALLLRAGALVQVVAPRPSAGLRKLASKRALRLVRRAYAARDLRGVELVIAATDRAEVNARVAADAGARRVPVNVVDQPALCSFIMPAIIDRSPVLVAVSTAGASPSLARLTRARLEAALPARLGELAAFAAGHREAVKRRVAGVNARRLFWDRALDGEIGELVLAGRARMAHAALERLLLADPARAGAAPEARVALIGAGDGDADRLPLEALRWLGRADVILHDARVSPSVLALGRREAERVDAGRIGLRAGWSLERVARSAARHARGGRVVCVLRVGDPYAGAARETRLLERSGVVATRIRPAPGTKP